MRTLTMHDKENMLAFIAGDVLVMVVNWIHMDIWSIAAKIGMTVILGVIGGIASLVGKDLYELLKARWKGAGKDGTV